MKCQVARVPRVRGCGANAESLIPNPESRVRAAYSRVRARPITISNFKLRQPNPVRPQRARAMRAMITDRKTISIMKACELVGVSRRTIYNWIASGKIEYVRTAGGSVRIFVDTLWREPSRTAEFHTKEAS
jgi:excisionase family DNA binding protein